MNTMNRHMCSYVYQVNMILFFPLCLLDYIFLPRKRCLLVDYLMIQNDAISCCATVNVVAAVVANDVVSIVYFCGWCLSVVNWSMAALKASK